MKEFNKIKQILMERDGLSSEEAQEIIDETRAELIDAIDGTSCLSPEEVLANELGLELDYIWDLL